MRLRGLPHQACKITSIGTGRPPPPQPTASAASAIFEVDGATAGSSINLNTNDTGATNTDGFTTGLNATPSRLNTGGSAETSTLKIELDATGSTLIQVTGDIFLNNAILDVDTLGGFTGAGNVAGDPGCYRLASYTGDLYDSGGSTVDPGGAVALTSDDGLSYSLVNDPGYLTIQVAAIPEPASAFVLTALGGATLLRRRRR